MKQTIFEEINDENFKMNDEIIYHKIDFNKNFQPKDLPTISEEKINKLIKEIKGHLQSKCKDDELITYLTLTILSLKEQNGNMIDDLLEQIIDKCNIKVSSGTTNDLLLQNGYINDEDDQGLTIIDEPINLWNSNKIIYPKYNIFIGRDNYLEIEVLDTIIHEIRHVLTSIKKPGKYKNRNTFIRRMGLAKYEYKRNSKEIQSILNDSLDEAFNTYYTEQLIYNILRYKNISIEDEKIKNYLKKIKNYYMSTNYYSYSYVLEKQLIAPLINNKELSKEINKQSFYGDIDSLGLNDIGTQLEYIIFDADFYSKLIEEKNYNETNRINTNIKEYKELVLKRSK